MPFYVEFAENHVVECKIKSGVALYVFLRKPQKASYLILRTAARLSSFFQKAKRLAFKAVLRCMDGASVP